MAPFHPTGQNPTLALERDLDLIVAPRPARLRRGVDRRAPLRRLRDHLVARGVHRDRGGTDEAHPARQRRQLAAVPPPAAARRPLRAARPPHARPRHARLRARPAHVRRAHARHPGRPTAAAHARGARSDHGAAARRDRHDGDRLVHAAGRAPAAEAVQRAEPRGRGRGIDLAHRRDRRRHVRRRAAVDRRDDAPGLRRDRHALADVERGRRPARAHRRSREVASRRTDAPRRDQGAGAQGRRVRHRAVLALLHARAARPGRCAATPRRRSSTTSTRTASR